jgi:hypothetical protein
VQIFGNAQDATVNLTGFAVTSAHAPVFAVTPGSKLVFLLGRSAASTQGTVAAGPRINAQVQQTGFGFTWSTGTVTTTRSPLPALAGRAATGTVGTVQVTLAPTIRPTGNAGSVTLGVVTVRVDAAAHTTGTEVSSVLATPATPTTRNPTVAASGIGGTIAAGTSYPQVDKTVQPTGLQGLTGFGLQSVQYDCAVALTGQAIHGDLGQAAWESAITPDTPAAVTGTLGTVTVVAQRNVTKSLLGIAIAGDAGSARTATELLLGWRVHTTGRDRIKPESTSREAVRVSEQGILRFRARLPVRTHPGVAPTGRPELVPASTGRETLRPSTG